MPSLCVNLLHVARTLLKLYIFLSSPDCRKLPTIGMFRAYLVLGPVSAMAATSSGNLALLQFFKVFRVDIYSTDGQYIRHIDVEQPDRLHDIASEHGILFVSELFVPGIHIVHENNTYIRKLEVTTTPACSLLFAIAVTGDFFWVSCDSGLFKMRFDRNYDVTDTKLIVPADRRDNSRLGLLAESSRIVMTDVRTHRIYFLYSNGTEMLPSQRVYTPMHLATDPCGRYFVAQDGLEVALLSEKGFPLETDNIAIYFNGPALIILNNTLFGTCQWVPNYILASDLT